MSSKSFLLSEELAEYVRRHCIAEDPAINFLVKETATLGVVSGMQIALEQAGFLTWLVGALGVRSAVEVGTFTGCSSLAIARGLPSDGSLICCDISEEWTAIAREGWALAGVSDRISLRIAPAAATLATLPVGSIEFAFIDADKGGYLQYYELILERLTPNGVIVVDNTLWDGAVIDAAQQDEDTVAIRAFNDAITNDDRVQSVLLPVADGLTLIRKSKSE